jgi:hypothetical protein
VPGLRKRPPASPASGFRLGNARNVVSGSTSPKAKARPWPPGSTRLRASRPSRHGLSWRATRPDGRNLYQAALEAGLVGYRNGRRPRSVPLLSSGFRTGPDSPLRSRWAFESHLPRRRASSSDARASGRFQGEGRLGTTMPVTRGSPSIQGDVPGPDPARAPLARRLPGGLACRGAAGGSALPGKVRDAARRCPRERRAWSTFGPHAIGAERFATVSSGLRR